MKRELLAIYGPLSINSYGVAIALGILIFLWLIKKNPQAIKLKLNEHILDLMLISIVTGVLGGRLLYMITEPEADISLFNFFSFWDGGFSLLGAVTAIVPVLAYCLHRIQIPILPCLDVVAIYAPLIQSISRIGCFFAGCCYGCTTTYPWGFTYTDPQSMAPLHQALHPAQLYSAISLLGIFALLYFVLQKVFTKPGQLLAAYLFLISIERFSVDFWRADRVIFNAHTYPLSLHQNIALYIALAAAIFFIQVTFSKITRDKHEHI